ncbi:MAG: P1 family peptidase [Candidatus Palauibacterales bacterium]|nr:P1 family peptidase [Candidatus Palauibacterales bacterium]MDP2528443.1 P1 family peptidase [Candidatus Palauibacterales bacterium]MDP2584272.1 P1 family peptidase [Candidatus Palauibacterales bacterium]
MTGRWRAARTGRRRAVRFGFLALALAVGPALASGPARAQQSSPRSPNSEPTPSPQVGPARQLGVPFSGTPGRFDAITDVPGVEVGMTTLIRGEGKLIRGQGPVRTGVTVIFPLGKRAAEGVGAGRAVSNGTGEFTGMEIVDETGLLFGPVALTGTGNIAVVRQGIIDWSTRPGFLAPREWIARLLPAVGETLDLGLNDVFGHPMAPRDVYAALDSASGGPVAQGNVGGGTGMVSYGFKGGTGTASRIVRIGGRSYVVGVLIQANNGSRRSLTIAGVPVGREITDLRPRFEGPRLGDTTTTGAAVKHSLLVVIATNAPLVPHQLRRLARRAGVGSARLGSFGGNLSGDFAVAFSTAARFDDRGTPVTATILDDWNEATMDALFEGSVQATEEAEVNALVAARTMTGADGSTVYALPHDRLVALLERYGRYAPPKR